MKYIRENYSLRNQAIADYLSSNGYSVSFKEFCREANVVSISDKYGTILDRFHF